MSRYLLPDLVISAQRIIKTSYRSRGADYADDDSITDIQAKLSNNLITITARIHGTDTYDTSITVHTSDHRLVWHDCSCPAHDGRPGCKHVAWLVRYAAHSPKRSQSIITKQVEQYSHIVDVDSTSSDKKTTTWISQWSHYAAITQDQDDSELMNLVDELIPYLQNNRFPYTDPIKMLIVILVEHPKVLRYAIDQYYGLSQLLHQWVGNYIDTNTIFEFWKRSSRRVKLELIPDYIPQMWLLQWFAMTNTTNTNNTNIKEEYHYSVRLVPIINNYTGGGFGLGIYQHKSLKSGKFSVGKLIKESDIRNHRIIIPTSLQAIIALSSYKSYEEYHQITFEEGWSTMIDIIRSLTNLYNHEWVHLIAWYQDDVTISLSLKQYHSSEYGDNIMIKWSLIWPSWPITLPNHILITYNEQCNHYALTDYDTVLYFFQSSYILSLTTQLLSAHGLIVSAEEFEQFRQQAWFRWLASQLHEDNGVLVDIKSIKPCSHLTISYDENYSSLSSQIIYSYHPDPEIIDPISCVTWWQSKQFITLLDGSIVRRDMDEESKLKQSYEHLMLYYDEYDSLQDIYSITIDWNSKTLHQFFDAIDEHIRQWWVIRYLQAVKKIIKAKPKASISVSSWVDWLNASVEIEWWDNNAQWQEDLIWQAISNGKREILLDNDTLVQLEQDISQLSQQLAQRWLDKPWKSKRITRSQLITMDDSNDCHFVFDKKTLSLRQQLLEFDTIKQYPLPSWLQVTLRPYQYDGYRWLSFLYEYGFGGILADDMGLGKTIQTITLLSKIYLENQVTEPSLIVCPTSLTYNWQQEIGKFAPDLRTHWIQSWDEQINHNISQTHIYIISYGVLNRWMEAGGTNQQWHYLICDEAQTFKNPHSQRAKNLSQIHASHHLALSGTPIENNLSELWSIFHIISPGLLDNYNKFVSQWVKNESADLKLLSKIIKPFVLRRTKEQVLPDLPPKVEEVIYLEMETEQAALYHKLETQYRQDIYEKLEQDWLNRARFGILDALLKLRQACLMPALIPWLGHCCNQSAKLSYLSESLEELIQGWHTVLIFSQFTGFLAHVREVLDHLWISYLYLDGSTPAKQRKSLVEQFNQGQTQVFIISLKAGGTGLNLVAADYVIHLDPWRNPAVEQQASDRAHRIGQTKTVFVQKLIIKNSIEEKILQLQERKKHLIDDIFSHDFSGSLTADDIKFILN
jgi:SNF2 family DNA or RNA helicase